MTVEKLPDYLNYMALHIRRYLTGGSTVLAKDVG
jgi:hypothetical protein